MRAMPSKGGDEDNDKKEEIDHYDGHDDDDGGGRQSGPFLSLSLSLFRVDDSMLDSLISFICLSDLPLKM